MPSAQEFRGLGCWGFRVQSLGSPGMPSTGYIMYIGVI